MTELDPGKPLATTSEKGSMDATESAEHEITAALRAGTIKRRRCAVDGTMERAARL
ncbi:MAG TPA: hypothetical protein K8U77_09680 [Slackia equolifaciens]|uniref:Uncharacterized protein n=1 Tax=Slackia equolifaciens TaxID=498718 RepID=A0A9D2UYL3_9ACTN|nr:hypothetical protein [Slackia equolifaciens]